MRRGHSGIGGWRNENPAHFRPRGVAPPIYRHTTIFPLHDGPRFPPNTPRPLRVTQPFTLHPRPIHNRNRPEINDRNRFRIDNRYRNQEIYPPLDFRPNYPFQQTRYDTPQYDNFYSDSYFYDDYETTNRDIDQRQINNTSQIPNIHNQDQSWSNDIRMQTYKDKSPCKTYVHENETNKLPIYQAGHRPPSSDHYCANPDPMVNNSNSFSHSVDDTVNIVRNRLLNRNDIQQSIMETTSEPSEEINKNLTIPRMSNQNQEIPTKRKPQRHRPNLNTKFNCDQMKKNIEHQLFKMDKGNIHKLIDDPSCSSKFEYAINCLITESRNSLNRHLRSVAEKSLYNSSTEFINSDDNTIYEDTFMKQMQCFLDPQDTIILEDIKPIVMAELNKVLQLDEIDKEYILPDCQSSNQFSKTDNDQHNENPNYEDYSRSSTEYPKYDSHVKYESDDFEIYDDMIKNYDYTGQENRKPLFDRRLKRNSCDYNEERRISSESRQHSRMSDDNRSIEQTFTSAAAPSFFNNTVDITSDEDETFAELDKQYHVAVDHNFIKTEDPTDVQKINANSSSKSPSVKSETSYNSQNLDIDLNESFKFCTDLHSSVEDNICVETKQKEINSKDVFDTFSCQNITTKDDKNILEQSNKEKECVRSDKSKSGKSSTQSSARKSSLDQGPSHRKEKRKKSESSPTQSNKISNIKEKDTNINNTKSSEHEEKSVFSLCLSKSTSDKEQSKEIKNYQSNIKEYCEKFVKRKESPKKSHKSERNINSRQRSNFNTSSHSIVSPKKNVNKTQTTNKVNVKSNLKTIDMFLTPPKKLNVHQACRNTAIAPTTAIKDTDEMKSRLMLTIKKGQIIHPNKQISRIVTNLSKDIQTTVNKGCTSRSCQTDMKKYAVKSVQTDPVCYAKSESRTTDISERMKEIDWEIQVLLHEKFRLSSSLDSKQSDVPSLSSAVYNVPPETNDNEIFYTNSSTGDCIIEDFTDISVEELEQITFDSVQQEPSTVPTLEIKRRQCRKDHQSMKKSENPARNSKRAVKNVNTPNISLIEQILVDDRPIEDIISLQDLESPAIKTRKRAAIVAKNPPQKPKRRKKKNMAPCMPIKTAKDNKLKECSVVLTREDISKYLNLETVTKVVPALKEAEGNIAETKIIEEVVNDLHFDMLDVSEDIVIGDSYDAKLEEKDSSLREYVTLNEDIILDNSQSSEEVNVLKEEQQNECKVYDYSSDESLKRDSLTLSVNVDTVLAIECIENNFIAACLDGSVYYFDGDGHLISMLRGSNLGVTCLTIVKDKYGTTVYTGSLDSRIRYYDLETGLEKGPECNVLSSIHSMDLAWDTVFVGTDTGFVLQFEYKNNMLIPVSTVKFSEQTIFSLRAMKEGPRKVLLVAARTENVTIKDAQTGLLLRTFEGPNMTVLAVLYEDGKVYCGTSSHQIQAFDYTSGNHVFTLEGGKGALCLRAAGGLLFAGCYDGCVYVYREGEAQPFAQLCGPNIKVFSLAILGTKIIAAYKDRSFFIWKMPLCILQEMVL